jgi:hypothetical protein
LKEKQVRKYLELSAIALLTTAISAVPAHALSLNLGGDGPLVDLGDDNHADATVSLDTGNLLGSDSGSGGTEAGAVIDLNLGSAGGDGDGGLLGGNGLIDLGGDNDNGLIDLDGDLLDFGSTGGLLDLGDNGDIIDLAGLNLGDGALLDLSGNDDINAAIEIDLGDGDLLDLGTTGAIGGGGGNGNGGGGSGGGNGNGGGGVANGGNGGLLADTGAACLTLTSAQIDELIRRHIYNRATFNSWASAQSLRVVEVELCEGEIAEVAAAAGADANVARLQAFLAAQAKVRAGLQSKGHAPGDVIAADHSGEVLTVYVI